MLSRRREIVQLNRDHGFTMIEALAVLIILGIIAAVIFSRGTSTGAYSAVSEAEILKSHLRFAQLKAMNGVGTAWGITVGSSSYTLACTVTGTGGTCPNPIPNLPGESSKTHTFNGVSGPNTSQTVNFDIWGVPDNNSFSITLTSGSDNAGISITPITGFIQ